MSNRHRFHMLDNLDVTSNCNTHDCQGLLCPPILIDGFSSNIGILLWEKGKWGYL